MTVACERGALAGDGRRACVRRGYSVTTDWTWVAIRRAASTPWLSSTNESRRQTKDRTNVSLPPTTSLMSTVSFRAPVLWSYVSCSTNFVLFFQREHQAALPSGPPTRPDAETT